MSVNKEHAQSESNDLVLFEMLNTGGTPSIDMVSPATAVADISVVDTAAGRATVTIKNFKGPNAAVNIQATSESIHVWTSVVSFSYSGDDLTFELSSTDDAHSATDTSVFVRAEAF